MEASGSPGLSDADDQFDQEECGRRGEATSKLCKSSPTPWYSHRPALRRAGAHSTSLLGHRASGTGRLASARSDAFCYPESYLQISGGKAKKVRGTVKIA